MRLAFPRASEHGSCPLPGCRSFLPKGLPAPPTPGTCAPPRTPQSPDPLAQHWAASCRREGQVSGPPQTGRPCPEVAPGPRRALLRAGAPSICASWGAAEPRETLSPPWQGPSSVRSSPGSWGRGQTLGPGYTGPRWDSEPAVGLEGCSDLPGVASPIQSSQPGPFVARGPSGSDIRLCSELAGAPAPCDGTGLAPECGTGDGWQGHQSSPAGSAPLSAADT